MTANWIGGSGNWSNPANWDIGVVPNNSGATTYDVVINVAASNPTITVNQNVTIDSLTSTETVNIAQRTVTLLTGLTNSGSLIVEAGQYSLSDAQLRLPASTVTNDGSIVLRTDGQQASVFLAGDVMVNGTGSLILEHHQETLVIGTGTAELTVGVGQLVRGAGQIQVPVNNHGTLQGDVAGATVPIARTLYFTDPVQSDGTIRTQNSGSLSLQAGLTSNGQLSATGSGTLTLKGAINHTGDIIANPGSTVHFDTATVNNSGRTLRADRGTLKLDTSTVNGGELEVTNNSTSLVHLIGNVTTNSVTLNDIGAGEFQIPELANTQLFGDYAHQLPAGKTLVIQSGVSNIFIPETAQLRLAAGNFKNDGRIVVRGFSTSASGVEDAKLHLLGDVTLSGSGELVMEHVSAALITGVANAKLTIAPDQLVRGEGQFQVPVDNHGTLQADTVRATAPISRTLSFTKLVESDGTIRAQSGGSLALNAGVTSTGSLAITGSGTLTLKGEIDHDGDIVAGPTSTVLFENATVSNLGRTLRADRGTLRITDSIVSNGTLEATDNLASLVQFVGNVTLTSIPWVDAGAGEFQVPAGVTTQLFGDYFRKMPSDHTLVIEAGPNVIDTARLKLPAGDYRNDGQIIVQPSGVRVSSLYLNGSTNVSGSGEIVLVSQQAAQVLGVAGAVLTIGADQTLRGQGSVLLDVVNHGLIQAGTDTKSLTIDGTIENRGEIRTITGGILIATGLVTNYGVLDPGQDGGDIDINSGLRIHDSGIINSRPGGTIRVSGSILGTAINYDRYAANTGLIVMDGTGTAATPRNLEVMSDDRGAIDEGFNDNFVYPELALSGTNYVKLLNESDNAPGTGAEALYVNVLRVPAGTTLDLNGFNVYARAFQTGGTILNGTVTKVNDGGSIEVNQIIQGAISTSGQVDEWTFFGRAGRTVQIGVSTSLPFAPIINWARVRLVDPQGNVIATDDNVSSGSGTPARIPDKLLTVDGVYKVRIDAAPGHATATGNYQFAVWDTTVDSRPLVFNQTSIGSLETPFSLDQWTFSASAGQQIQLDFIDAAGADIGFTLKGPGGWTGFTDLTADSALINLPSSGQYTITAENQIFQFGSIYSFQLNVTSLTDLAIDVPFTGTLAGSAQFQLFRLPIVASAPLIVTLTNPSLFNHVELYMRIGAPPTRTDYDFRSILPGAADQQISLPTAALQDWYILVYAPQVPDPGSFTLLATVPFVGLNSVTPDHHGNSADAVLTLRGVGFREETSVELVAANGATYQAESVVVSSFTQMTATIEAGTVPAGVYDVHVRREDGRDDVLEDAFKVVDGGSPRLITNLINPNAIFGYNSNATLYIEYENAGEVAMPAPMLSLNVLQKKDDVPFEQFVQTWPAPTCVHNGGPETPALCTANPFPDYLSWLNWYRGYLERQYYQNAKMTLDGSLVRQGFWSDISIQGLAPDEDLTEANERAHPEGFSSSISILATGQSPGLLQPGEKGRIPVYWVGWKSPHDLTDPAPFLFSLTETTADEVGPTSYVGWDYFKSRMRPDTVLSNPNVVDAWDVIWDNFREQTGDTWGEYVQMLSENAVHLAQQGQNVKNVSELLSLEILQSSGGLNPIRTLAADVDVSLDAPGFPLQFSRGFAQSIESRFRLGPLGRGWRHTWETKLDVASDGKVHLTDGQNRLITFQPDRRGGYQTIGESGAKLTLVAGLGYRIVTTNNATWAFKLDGKLDFTEDSFGNRATATYTSGLLTRVAHSSGPAIRIEYNAQGRIARLLDSFDRETIFGYDALDQHLTSVQHPDGTTTTYEYELNGTLRSFHALLSASREGVTQSYTYDEFGRLVSAQDAGQETPVVFDYDTAGSLTIDTSVDQPTTLRFDHRGNLVFVKDPFDEISSLRYDAKGRLTAVLDPFGASTSFGYDQDGNLTNVIDPLGRTGFGYDSQSRLVSLTDANSHSTTWGRDADGNPTSLTYPDASNESIVYDAQGNIISSTNRRGETISYSYDAQGRLTGKAIGTTSLASYTYDSRGRMATATNHTGTMIFTYDTFDQLRRVDYPAGRFVTYDYLDGRVTQIATGDAHATNYEYDALGRLKRVLNADDPQDVTLVVEYQYDSLGRVEREDFGNGGYTITGYGELDRIESIYNYGPGGTVLSFFEYEYDAAGRRTRVASHDGVWAYDYDATGQLTHAVLDSANPAIQDQDLVYEYDALGNRTRTILNGVVTEYVTNSLNQYTRVGNVDYVYDANGNLIAKSDGSSHTTYDYDQENRLVRVTSPDGIWEYEYDALGNRVRALSGSDDRRLLVDPIGMSDLLAEYDSAGTRRVGYRLGKGIVSQSDPGGDRYYSFDALGSTVAIAGSGGGVGNRYSYGPFGEVLQASESGQNDFEFAGRYGVSHDLSELLCMRARMFDPAIGRFNTPDPIKLMGGDLNLYRYVSNQPTALTDPSGLNPSKITFPIGDLPFIDALPIEAECYTFQIGDDLGCSCSVLLGFSASVGPSFGVGRGPGYMGGSQASMGVGTTGGCTCGYSLGLSIIFDHEKCDIADLIPPLIPSPPLVGPFPIPILLSLDPNVKESSGFGTRGFVQEANVIGYRVDFQNDASATAASQVISIQDQLSADLDWSTFAVTEVSFGDVIIDVPVGVQNYETFVPFTYNGHTFDVQVTANLGLDTGLFTIWFVSMDPETGLPPDVLTGFLPPEDGTGRGQGYISYTISPKAGLPTGTEIRNVATIQFDFGEIINTNQVDPHDPSQGTDPTKEALITIDAGAPTSSVNSLPATSTTTSLELSWQGADDHLGSGIKHYDIYVSIDNGPIELFLSGLTANAATIPVETGRRYAFYSVATDNVGHVELPPVGFDAEIEIVSPLTLDAGADVASAEGAFIDLAGASFTYSGDASLLSGSVNWGDGSEEPLVIVPSVGGDTFSNEHTFADDGDYTIVLSLTDGTTSLEETLLVAVSNMAPQMTVTGNSSVNEGAIFLLALGSILDPGADTISSYRIEWGDGQSDNLAADLLPADRMLSHTYADGTTNVRILVHLTDEDGEYLDVATHDLQVFNVEPTLTLAGAGHVDEGAAYELTLGAVIDPGDDSPISYAINWGDGQTQNVPFDQLPPDRKLTHVYADGAASYSITVDLVDEDGIYTAIASHAVEVQNVPPQLNLLGSTEALEGQTYELTLGSIIDPGQDTVTSYLLDWGDGQTESISTEQLPPDRKLTHVYANGTAAVQITVGLVDEDGSYDSAASLPVLVRNVAPTPSAGSDLEVNEGQLVTISGSYVDPGALDAVTLSWTVLGPNDELILELDGQDLTFTPADEGVYRVVLRASDEEGANEVEVRVTVPPVAPTATLTNAGDVLEGSPGSVSFADPFDPSSADQLAGFRYSFDFDDDGTFEIVQSTLLSATVPSSYLDDGPVSRTVRGRIEDKDGVYRDYTTTLGIQSVAPTATFSNGGSVQAGQDGTVTFSAFFDPSSADSAAGFLYSYDFDNDGTFDVVKTAAATITVPGTYLSTPGTHRVLARIEDKDSASTDYTSDLLVVAPANQPPTANPATVSVTEDGRIGFTLTASDAETAPAQLIYTIISLPQEGQLARNGQLVQVGDSFIGSPALTYEPGAAREGTGADGFVFAVTDGSGAVGALTDDASVTIGITKAVADGQVTIDASGIVRVGGTSANNDILVTRTLFAGKLQVRMNGSLVSGNINLSDINQIRVWGRNGNDTVTVLLVDKPTLVHGGLGNDTIVGGLGENLLFGGGGNDNLLGGARSDLLIGGLGADTLADAIGNDIQVGGDVSHAFTDDFLRDVLAQWSAGRTQNSRFRQTFTEDLAVDALFDSLGDDWFVLGSGDKKTDINPFDQDVVTA